MSYAGKSAAEPGDGGSMADLVAAVQEADAHHQRRRKKERKRRGLGPLSGASDYLRAAAGGAALLLMVLVADGLRREALETSAAFRQVNGQVILRKGGVGAGVPAALKTEPTGGDLVQTGPDGSATLVFADGSALQIEPNTQVELRLLDFARGEVRSRSLMLRSGRVVMRTSRYSGSRSETTLCTPTAVAATRDASFSLYYDPARRDTYVAGAQGTVQLRTSVGQSPVAPGQMLGVSGYLIGTPQTLNAGQLNRIRSADQLLARYEQAPGFVQKLEYGINAFFDPALQLIGLAPGGWSYAAGSAARRSATMEALKRLQQHMVSLQDEQIPEAISLTTLDDLGVDPEGKRRMMDTFSGNLLEGYRKLGVGHYEIRARSRDARRTLYALTPQGVTQINE